MKTTLPLADSGWCLMVETRIDWVSMTFQNGVTPQELLSSLLGGEEFEPAQAGLMGYKSQLVGLGGGVRILFDGSAGMGVHLQISGGKGCGRLAECSWFPGWQQFAVAMRDLGGVPSRFDVAVDDQAGLLTEARIMEHVRENQMTSRWRKVSYQTEVVRGGSNAGFTFGFGSKSSEVTCRIYDKAAEQGMAGIAHWVRAEWQYRNEAAAEVFALVCEGAWDRLCALGRHWLEFREAGCESNRSMAKIAAWWDDLFARAKFARVAKVSVAASLERKYAWLERQCAVALATLSAVAGGCVDDALSSLVLSGSRRMKKRDLALVAEAARFGWAGA